VIVLLTLFATNIVHYAFDGTFFLWFSSQCSECSTWLPSKSFSFHWTVETSCKNVLVCSVLTRCSSALATFLCTCAIWIDCMLIDWLSFFMLLWRVHSLHSMHSHHVHYLVACRLLHSDACISAITCYLFSVVRLQQKHWHRQQHHYWLPLLSHRWVQSVLCTLWHTGMSWMMICDNKSVLKIEIWCPWE